MILPKHYLIIHHDDMDGAAAAAIAKFAIREAAIKNRWSVSIYLYAATYGNEPPYHLMDTNTAVYILDFSYGRQETIKIHSMVESLQVLDHHKTSEEALKGLPYAHFDMTKSGALLAYEYFWQYMERHASHCITRLNPEREGGANVKRIYELLDNYDLWQKKSDDEDNLQEYLGAIKQECRERSENFVNWLMNWLFNHIAKNVFNHEVGMVPLTVALTSGECYRAKTAANITRVASTAFDTFIDGGSEGDVPAVVVFSHLDISMLGQYLYQKSPYSVVMIMGMFEKECKISLRSNKDVEEDLKIDCSEIAKHYVGGGHKHAAGFITTPRKALEIAGLLKPAA